VLGREAYVGMVLGDERSDIPNDNELSFEFLPSEHSFPQRDGYRWRGPRSSRQSDIQLSFELSIFG
jgi:hypothetical protein